VAEFFSHTSCIDFELFLLSKDKRTRIIGENPPFALLNILQKKINSISLKIKGIGKRDYNSVEVIGSERPGLGESAADTVVTLFYICL
jgi:hypothetical protein